MVIDTHTHVVSDDPTRHPRRDARLANGAWWADRDCSVEALAAEVDRSPVNGVVLVQAAGAYGDDNRCLVEAVSTDPSRRVGCCIIDPRSDAAGSAPDRLARWVSMPGIDGVRLFHIPSPSPPWLGAHEGSALIDRAAELGLAISVCCLPGDLPAVGVQARRRPDVALTLDHCGFADFSGGPPFVGAGPLWELAELPNVHVKLTPTLVRMAGCEPPALVSELVARFGAERMMWGSDWPQHREPDGDGGYLDYAAQVALVRSWLAHLPADAVRAIEGGTARRLWPSAWNHPPLQEKR